MRGRDVYTIFEVRIMVSCRCNNVIWSSIKMIDGKIEQFSVPCLQIFLFWKSKSLCVPFFDSAVKNGDFSLARSLKNLIKNVVSEQPFENLWFLCQAMIDFNQSKLNSHRSTTTSISDGTCFISKHLWVWSLSCQLFKLANFLSSWNIFLMQVN